MREKSHLLARELHKLSTISRYSVVQGTSPTLDELNEYLHVEREVEQNLRSHIKNAAQSTFAQLILVCGNVGDGKSHILSYLNKEIAEDMDQFTIHNDATESHNPSEKSNETLNKVLRGFNADNIGGSSDKIILAINLGTLSNFLEEYGTLYPQLGDYVRAKKILATDVIEDFEFDPSSSFQHVNFTDYHMYSLTESGPKSKIIGSLLEKIVSDKPQNPIYNAYRNLNSLSFCPIRYNYEFLLKEENREAVVDLIIQAIVKQKEIVSVRTLLNFFYDLVVPVDLNWENIDSYQNQLAQLSASEKLSLLIPNYLFEHPELSTLFQSISTLDPCRFRYPELDANLVELINSEKPVETFKTRINEGIVDEVDSLVKDPNNSKEDLTKLFIRLNFFGRRKEISKLSDPSFNEFMTELYFYNCNKKQSIKKIYGLVQESARKWYGDPKKAKKVVLNIGRKQSKYRVFKDLKAEPLVDIKPEETAPLLTKFVQEFTLEFKHDKQDEPIKFHIDYGLFEILKRINEGYRPNKRDNNNYISFVSQILKLINQDSGGAALEIDEVNIGKESDYELTNDSFGEYKFRVL